MAIQIHFEKDTIFQTSSQNNLNIGFSASVSQLLPFTIAGGKRSSTNHRYEIQKVESQIFYPTQTYVRNTVAQPQVLKYLAEHKYHKSLFMIVGIKVGYDGQITQETKRKSGPQFNISVPSSLTGIIPLDFGAKFRIVRGIKRYQQKVLPSFVFAYRLREIRYFKRDGSTRQTEYTKGAVLHGLDSDISLVAEQTGDHEPNFLGVEDEIEIQGLAGEDFAEDEDDSMIIDGFIMVSPK
jgi:hypothetical protein